MTTPAGQRETHEFASAAPIDAVTIRETIRLARRLSASPLDHQAVAGLYEELRGHVHLLLPGTRDAAAAMWRGGTAWYQCAAQLSRITPQVEQPLSPDPFAALVQVQLLARDCEWLLTQHTTP
ncbi:DUF6415 family natural product biosynthesis protein [Streptomyces kronopolitis]|uniref:DUF6415 family natural product biosynthesis protein n=1 Tax=Streptomyces kronopolitis TaxID=1612435 RepID=UPI003436840E